jgi:hypothetical protein
LQGYIDKGKQKISAELSAQHGPYLTQSHASSGHKNILAKPYPETYEKNRIEKESSPLHEKLTNLGSLGMPSAPILFFLNLSCM